MSLSEVLLGRLVIVHEGDSEEAGKICAVYRSGERLAAIVSLPEHEGTQRLVDVTVGEPKNEDRPWIELQAEEERFSD